MGIEHLVKVEGAQNEVQSPGSTAKSAWNFSAARDTRGCRQQNKVIGWLFTSRNGLIEVSFSKWNYCPEYQAQTRQWLLSMRRKACQPTVSHLFLGNNKALGEDQGSTYYHKPMHERHIVAHTWQSRLPTRWMDLTNHHLQMLYDCQCMLQVILIHACQFSPCLNLSIITKQHDFDCTPDEM